MVHKRRHKRKLLAAPKPVTAIVHGRERTLRKEEIELVRNNYAKKATNEEFTLFMFICKKHKLDPTTGQVHCVIFEGERSGRSMVVMTGIGGYRAMAARSHKRDFGGTGAALLTYDPGDELGKTPAGRRIPSSATVKAFRKSARGIEFASEATCYWEEFAPFDLKASRSDFWNRMPKHMLAKCAESHALRKAFPDLSNIYSIEEMDAKMQDQTPEGRQISVEGTAPQSRQIVDSYKAAKAEQQKILNKKLRHGHAQGSARGQEAEETLRRVEEADERFANAKNVTPDSSKREAKEETKRGTGGKKSGASHSIPAGAAYLSGTIHNIIHGTTSERKVPFIKLQLNRDWFTVWSKSIQKAFPPGREQGMIGNVVECYTQPTGGIPDIVGLKRIGDQYFDSDGRTPITREPGAEGL